MNIKKDTYRYLIGICLLCIISFCVGKYSMTKCYGELFPALMAICVFVLMYYIGKAKE